MSGAALVVAMAGAGCAGVIGGDDGTSSSSGGNGKPNNGPKFAPAMATIHRLTGVQLRNSWLALFGNSLTLPPLADLPQDDQLYGFTSISAASRAISPLDVEKYEAATYHVLEQVWADAIWREAIVGCTPTAIADGCAASYFSSFGLRAWRRPLDQAEVDKLVELATTVADSTADPWEGLRFGTAAVLQSPHFLFRIEVGTPATDEGHAGLLRYTAWEMASRLSFLLSDTTPSSELLDAAAKGALDDPAMVRAFAEKLIEEPGARASLVRFFRDFMNIGRLDQLDKSIDKFPQFSQTLGPAMQSEIERLFEHTVFDTQGDFRQLFTTRETFVNEELANIYGIKGISGPAFVPTTLPNDGKRGGLLTTPGFLALNAHQTATSPTHRGRFVRIGLMCQDVSPPPPGVDTTVPAPDPNKPTTLRQRLEEHRENEQCRPCHMMMDPIGFGFEHYDAIGGWRELDDGLPVNAASDLDGKPFDGAVALGELIAALPDAADCIARRFYQHATAHLEKKGDRPAVEALVQGFIASDYNFKQLVVEMVLNDGFRYASPAEVTP